MDPFEKAMAWLVGGAAVGLVFPAAFPVAIAAGFLGILSVKKAAMIPAVMGTMVALKSTRGFNEGEGPLSNFYRVGGEAKEKLRLLCQTYQPLAPLAGVELLLTNSEVDHGLALINAAWGAQVEKALLVKEAERLSPEQLAPMADLLGKRLEAMNRPLVLLGEWMVDMIRKGRVLRQAA